MSEESVDLEKSTALARRKQWQDIYDDALAANDQERAANALRFIREYDAFLALLEHGRERG